jgi:hypothetical protein
MIILTYSFKISSVMRDILQLEITFDNATLDKLSCEVTSYR